MGLSMVVVALVVETTTSVAVSVHVVVAISLVSSNKIMSHVVVNTVMATTTCSDIDTLVGVSTTSATTAMLNPMCGSTVAALTIGIYMFRLGICFPKMLIRARLRR